MRRRAALSRKAAIGVKSSNVVSAAFWRASSRSHLSRIVNVLSLVTVSCCRLCALRNAADRLRTDPEPEPEPEPLSTLEAAPLLADPAMSLSERFTVFNSFDSPM